jgi:hypothetical protein
LILSGCLDDNDVAKECSSTELKQNIVLFIQSLPNIIATPLEYSDGRASVRNHFNGKYSYNLMSK